MRRHRRSDSQEAEKSSTCALFSLMARSRVVSLISQGLKPQRLPSRHHTIGGGEEEEEEEIRAYPAEGSSYISKRVDTREPLGGVSTEKLTVRYQDRHLYPGGHEVQTDSAGAEDRAVQGCEETLKLLENFGMRECVGGEAHISPCRYEGRPRSEVVEASGEARTEIRGRSRVESDAGAVAGSQKAGYGHHPCAEDATTVGCTVLVLSGWSTQDIEALLQVRHRHDVRNAHNRTLFIHIYSF